MKRPELTNLSTKACRLLRPTVLAGLLAGALVLGGGLAWAQAGFQTGGSVIDRSRSVAPIQRPSLKGKT